MLCSAREGQTATSGVSATRSAVLSCSNGNVLRIRSNANCILVSRYVPSLEEHTHLSAYQEQWSVS